MAHDLIVDKSDWLPGPWQNEPDRIQWRTVAGLPGLICRGPSGALCGYAAVPPGHPLYGVGYSGCPQNCGETWCEHSPEVAFNVHGGLTYSDRCQAEGPICHVPEPGESDDVWWFGFDCAHAGDYCPGSDSRLPVGMRDCAYGLESTYRDLAYVRAEVEQFAEQLVKVPV